MLAVYLARCAGADRVVPRAASATAVTASDAAASVAAGFSPMLSLAIQCGLVLATVAPPWVAERLQPHGLELATFPSTGRGLRTTRPRAAGELLFSVDDCDVLIAERLVEDHVVLRAAAKAAAAAGGPLTDEQLISLYLAMERTEYVAALPPPSSVERAWSGLGLGRAAALPPLSSSGSLASLG